MYSNADEVIVCGPAALEDACKDMFIAQGITEDKVTKLSQAPERTVKDKAPKILKEYTMDDVEIHDEEDDCWIVIDNKVYDVTDFLDEHPGGGELILVPLIY